MRASNAGQIWRIRRHCTAPDVEGVEGGQGWEGREAGGNGKVVTTHGGGRATGVVATQCLFLVECSYVSEKVWPPYDIMMVPYSLEVALHDGALRFA